MSRRSSTLRSIAVYRLRSWSSRAAVLLIACLYAFPLYWMLTTSLSSNSAVNRVPPNLVPQWKWSNYISTWTSSDWSRYFANTIGMSAATVAFVVATSILAGYALAAMDFKAKRLIFGLFMITYMVTLEAILLPNFVIIKELGWLNTYQAQVVPFIATPFGIFLMRQHFRSLPQELWDSARLDGCGHLRFLFRIAVPITSAALATLALISLVWSWNAFLWPLVMTNTDSVRPLQLALGLYANQDQSQPVQLAAGASMVSAPILFVVLIFHKYLLGGFRAARLID